MHVSCLVWSMLVLIVKSFALIKLRPRKIVCLIKGLSADTFDDEDIDRKGSTNEGGKHSLILCIYHSVTHSIHLSLFPTLRMVRFFISTFVVIEDCLMERWNTASEREREREMRWRGSSNNLFQEDTCNTDRNLCPSSEDSVATHISLSHLHLSFSFFSNLSLSSAIFLSLSLSTRIPVQLMNVICVCLS